MWLALKVHILQKNDRKDAAVKSEKEVATLLGDIHNDERKDTLSQHEHDEFP